MKFGKSEKDITPHLLIAAIAAMLLYVATSWWAGSGESQQSAPAPEAKPVEPIAEAAKPEPPTAKAPDISIWDAAMSGNIEAVKQHLDAGANVNAKNDEDGTPLHFATFHGHKEIAELLIANGADVNAKNNYGDTPLDSAQCTFKFMEPRVIDAHKETADLLRKHGGKTGEELKAEGK